MVSQILFHQGVGPRDQIIFFLPCPLSSGRVWSCKVSKVVEKEEEIRDPNSLVHILDNYFLHNKITNVIQQSTNILIVEYTTEKNIFLWTLHT